MQRWNGFADVPGDVGPTVVGIGVFDGVHRGHRSILERVVAEAKRRGDLAVIVTFDPHPAQVVGRPAPLMLTALNRRVQLLFEAGVDRVFVLPFGREISEWSPGEFVRRLLVDTLHVEHVVVGANFRFGHKQAGDTATLAELGKAHGFTVDAVPLLTGDADVVSSTWVRDQLAAGDVEAAAQGLGRLHSVAGPVVRGDGRGRGLGFPTANVEVPDGVAVPADGVYAGWLTRADGSRLPAAISVGTNPTFDGVERRVEAYALDVDIDLYGEHVQVEFAQRLRGMERFDGVEALIAQMHKDVEESRRRLT